MRLLRSRAGRHITRETVVEGLGGEAKLKHRAGRPGDRQWRGFAKALTHVRIVPARETRKDETGWFRTGRRMVGKPSGEPFCPSNPKLKRQP